MASQMIGRATCPECGFAGAHVKESAKCVYRWCPECGSQHYAKTDRQRADLAAKTRPLAAPTATACSAPAPAAKPAAKPAAAAPAPDASATATGSASDAPPLPLPVPPAPAAKRAGLFGF